MKIMNKTWMAVMAGTALLAGAAYGAGYKATGDDGVTASPKLRDTLNERVRISAVTPAPAKPMGCGMCTDAYVTRVEPTTKGAFKRTTLVAKHGCSDCETTVSAKGFGKASRDSVTHKCSGTTASVSCCAPGKT